MLQKYCKISKYKNNLEPTMNYKYIKLNIKNNNNLLSRVKFKKETSVLATNKKEILEIFKDAI